MRLSAPFAVIALASALACDSGPPCSEGALQGALDRAAPGDTVRAGACTIEGSLTIPRAVTLAGQGVDETLLEAPQSDLVVRLGPDAALESLTVHSTVRIAVQATDGGAPSLVDVHIQAERGVGLLADGLDALALEDVRIEGLVTRATADEDRFQEPTPESVPTHGLLLLGVASASLSEVHVTGFARFGVGVTDAFSGGATESTFTFLSGSITENLGVGLFLAGAVNAELEGVTVADTLQGLRLDPPYGMIVSGDAHATATDLELANNDRYGLLLDQARIDLTNLTATDNGDAALWLGTDGDARILGSGTVLRGNAFAGLVAMGVQALELRDARIAATRESRRNVGAGTTFGSVSVGDGVHLVRSHDNVVLDALRLEDNGRSGLLVDLGPENGAGISFENVVVSGTGDELGAIAGTTDDPAAPRTLSPVGVGDWDQGITREGVTVDNDAAFTDVLDVAGVSVPSSPPDPADLVGAVMPSS